MNKSLFNTQDPHAILHVPEDMTVQAGAEVTLAALQRELARHGQWLPVDAPGDLSLRAFLDANASGPRRYGYGTVREHLIGIRVRLPSGLEVQSGGNVVKNVAGYDLCKLFIGAQGRLGDITGAAFKLRPLPEVEVFLQADPETWEAAARLLGAVLDSPAMPVVLDLVSPLRLVVGFAGTRAEVDWQLVEMRKFGIVEPGALDYVQALPRRVSVLPSRVVDVARALCADCFVARAGNGVIEYRGGTEPPPPPSAPARLVELLEAAFQ